MTKLMPIGVLLYLCFSMPMTMAEECDDYVCFGLDWREATVQDVRDWLRRSGDVNAKEKKDDWTALHYAARHNNNPEVIKLLLAAGADINAKMEDDWTPLHYTALHNANPEVIKLLLAAGADVNAKIEDGRTPLHLAAWKNNNPEVIKLLLAAGADINAKDKNDNMPLHYAVFGNDNPEVIKLLFAAGADINAKNKYGTTLLHVAAEHDNPEAIKLLLAAGADVSAKKEDGWTPLHLAARYTDNPEVIKPLLAAGADIKAKNDGGDKPLRVAKDNDNSVARDILRKAGDYNSTAQQQQLQRELLVLKEDLQAYKENFKEDWQAYKEDLQVYKEDWQAYKKSLSPEIMTVAQDGNIRKLRQLLDEGADVRATDLFGVTAFDIARQERNAELLNLLLDYEDKQSGNASLPPPVQVDLNLIKMNNFIDTEDYFSAVVVLERIKNFNEQHGVGDLPPSLKFKYAEILQLDGQNDKAVKALTEYLQVAERGSENYIQALQMLENLR